MQSTIYGRGRKRTMQGMGIGSFLKSAYTKGKSIYDKLKQVKPASKVLSVLDNPILGSAFQSLPYAGKIKQGLEMAQKAGFGKKGKKRRVGRPKGRKNK